jgi:radical SAM protein with 4Fe4S-binding SPASM domain
MLLNKSQEVIEIENSITHQFDRVNVEIINSCNLQCSFCPAGDGPKSVMSPAQFFGIAKSLRGKTKEIVLHLLGEPLSHPDLAGILSAGADAGIPINVVTNGLLLQGERAEHLLRPIVRQVSISLQSFADNFKDQSPEAYVKRVKGFADLALDDRPDLYLNLRFWDISSMEDSRAPNEAVAGPAALMMREALARAFEFDWATVRIDLKRKKNHRLRARQYLHFDSRFVWPSLQNEILQSQGFCHGLTGHFGIHANGTVVPCCLDHKADISLGNVFERPIDEILSSARAKAIREGFARRALVEDLCKRCGFISRFN